MLTIFSSRVKIELEMKQDENTVKDLAEKLGLVSLTSFVTKKRKFSKSKG